MVKVNLTGGKAEQKEIDEYIARAKQKYPDLKLEEIDIHIDGDYVELKYHFDKLPNFQRIRRITGYLVGTTDRWNNAKKVEEQDRVKHSMCECIQGK